MVTQHEASLCPGSRSAQVGGIGWHHQAFVATPAGTDLEITLAVSRARKRKRSGRCKASAAAVCSSKPLPRQ
jgi:hypothetical protein